MPKSLEEWGEILDKLSGEDLENITKGVNSLGNVKGFVEEIPGLRSHLWKIGELAGIALDKRLKKMEKHYLETLKEKDS